MYDNASYNHNRFLLLISNSGFVYVGVSSQDVTYKWAATKSA